MLRGLVSFDGGTHALDIFAEIITRIGEVVSLDEAIL